MRPNLIMKVIVASVLLAVVGGLLFVGWYLHLLTSISFGPPPDTNRVPASPVPASDSAFMAAALEYLHAIVAEHDNPTPDHKVAVNIASQKLGPLLWLQGCTSRDSARNLAGFQVWTARFRSETGRDWDYVVYRDPTDISDP